MSSVISFNPENCLNKKNQSCNIFDTRERPIKNTWPNINIKFFSQFDLYKIQYVSTSNFLNWIFSDVFKMLTKIPWPLSQRFQYMYRIFLNKLQNKWGYVKEYQV